MPSRLESTWQPPFGDLSPEVNSNGARPTGRRGARLPPRIQRAKQTRPIRSETLAAADKSTVFSFGRVNAKLIVPSPPRSEKWETTMAKIGQKCCRLATARRKADAV